MSTETVLFLLLVLLVLTVPLGILIGHTLRRHQPPVPPTHPRQHAIAAINQTGEQVDQTVFPDPRRQ